MNEFVKEFFDELNRAINAVECTDAGGVRLDTNRALEGIFNMVQKSAAINGKVIIIGNGGSASIASHISVDLWKNGGVRATCFNDSSLLTCIGNDLGYENTFAAPIAMFAEPQDVLIAISSSGKSPNILNAVAAARKAECAVVTMSGFRPDNPLRGQGDINCYVPSEGYGFVETVHSALCHAVVDCVIKSRKTQ